MITVRLKFEKLGDAKYLAHLDVMRNFTRAIRMSGLDTYFTQGFNPILYITFAAPLSLGFESRCETCDIRLLNDGEDLSRVPELINRGLPYGIRVTEAYIPRDKNNDIAFSDWHIVAYTPDPEKEMQQFNDFVSLPEIIAKKKSKNGLIDIDIRKQIVSVCASAEMERMILDLRTTATPHNNLNPNLLLKTYMERQQTELEVISVTRMGLYLADLESFH